MKNKKRYFDKNLLPNVYEYYRQQFPAINNTLNWTLIRCPFHDDSKPSFSINLITGGFHCFACGARGGDILDFHRKRYQVMFRQAVNFFGAWRYE